MDTATNMPDAVKDAHTELAAILLQYSKTGGLYGRAGSSGTKWEYDFFTRYEFDTHGVSVGSDLQDVQYIIVNTLALMQPDVKEYPWFVDWVSDLDMNTWIFLWQFKAVVCSVLEWMLAHSSRTQEEDVCAMEGVRKHPLFSTCSSFVEVMEQDACFQRFKGLGGSEEQYDMVEDFIRKCAEYTSTMVPGGSPKTVFAAMSDISFWKDKYGLDKEAQARKREERLAEWEKFEAKSRESSLQSR